MPRYFGLISAFIAALAIPTAHAALLPGQFEGFKRQSVTSLALDNSGIWNEFGLKESEQAEYATDSGKLTIRAFRFADPTGAFAALQWQRNVASGTLVQRDNYLLDVVGELQQVALNQLASSLPDKVVTAAPPLFSYLPEQRRVPDSERYSLGPLSLAAFEPQLPARVVDFGLGAEIQFAEYRVGREVVKLALVGYPTPQIAAKRLPGYEALEGLTVSRSGPLVFVAFAKTAALAPGIEKLFSDVNYRPRIMSAEPITTDTPQDAAKMILSISLLALGLIVSSVFLGFAFGGFRILRGRFGIKDTSEELTTLNLQGK